MKKALVCLVLLAVVAVAAACETAQPKTALGVLSTIVVDPSSAQIEKGNVFSFTAKGLDSAGNPVVINPTWSVDKKFAGIITLVNPEGPKAAVRARAEGAAELVVSQGDIKTVVNIDVAGPDKFTSRTSK
ncbi:MAG TPA: hypothetical protein PLC67_00985 [Spirochaetota bacterium]|nr:hypothetical protein [Spirochaetota bacterium]